MRQIEISVMKPGEALNAFAQVWRAAEVGVLFAPYDEIVIHAAIRDAA